MNFDSRQRYSTGYIQCMHEVHNLLLSCPGMDKTLGARLLNHLLKSLPLISGESVATGTANGSPGPNSRSRSNSPDSFSPTPTRLSLPSTAFQQQHPSLSLPSSPSPPPTPQGPSSPSSPSSPHPSPGISLLNEGWIGGPGRDRPSPSSSPSPSPQPGHAHPALPPLFPVGDPSMWRPW